jgi:HEPN domain-containing protein
MDNIEKSKEWMKQSDYDFETAGVMLDSGRYIYCVFMCHLAIEKALKGIYQKTLDTVPPKTHNLVYLIEKSKLEPSESIGKFIVRINQASIATRYPEDFASLQTEYSETLTKDIFSQTKGTIEWIKKML